MSTINITANIVVAGGPAIPIKRIIEAEAYELMEFKVKAGEPNMKVELQPGTSMSLLVITADSYEAGLSFGVAKKTDEAPSFDLDHPLLLAGGAINVLGKEHPKVLYFSTVKAAAVTILVARKAT